MKESKRNFAAVEEDLFKLHYEKWAEHVKLIGPVVITKKGEPQYVFMDFERFVAMLSVFATFGSLIGVPDSALMAPPVGGKA
jgi:hypothetical protein